MDDAVLEQGFNNRLELVRHSVRRTLDSGYGSNFITINDENAPEVIAQASRILFDYSIKPEDIQEIVDKEYEFYNTLLEIKALRDRNKR